MPFRIACVAPASRRLSILILCLLFSLLPRVLAAKTPAAPSPGPGYVSALAAADHLLQAWQSGDVESGMALLTSHAKEAATTEVVERFFSSSGPSAYEVTRGKLVKRGRYEFPVVLFTGAPNNLHMRRRFSSIVVVNTGNNDWAVDKLP
jgi:hypothetical protein